MRKTLRSLENIGFNICLVDRAGNGMSSDTKEDRTVENIVEEYRFGIKREPKYIMNI